MYSESLTNEIEKIIKDNNLKFTVKNFKYKFNRFHVKSHQHFSEEFIEEFNTQVYWDNISEFKNLSESFIEKFKDRVDWYNISKYQKLSDSFIEKFQDKVDWGCISTYQKLSEEFIEKFQDKVDWLYISVNQKLSEKFIEKFQHKVDWWNISKYQSFSESFIEKFKDKLCWRFISKYQKLSPQLKKKYLIRIFKDNWLYKPVNFKLKYIKRYTNYEVIDNKYIIAYKGIRSDNYSKYNFQYKYEVGNTYESHCDCNFDDDNSFGLSAWNLKNAKEYCNEKIIKVKIAIKDIGCIVRNENKIRCFKFEVIEEVKDY